jgi:hypothetical protein
VKKLMADHGFSERRACRLIGVNRSAWPYKPLRGKDDAVRERMREIANGRRRFRYRRLLEPVGNILPTEAEDQKHVAAGATGMSAQPTNHRPLQTGGSMTII